MPLLLLLFGFFFIGGIVEPQLLEGYLGDLFRQGDGYFAVAVSF